MFPVLGNQAIALNAVSPEMLDQLGTGFHNHQVRALVPTTTLKAHLVAVLI